jgi:hypothetical protein
MAYGFKSRRRVAAAAMLVTAVATSPASAQFLAPGGFPVIAVPPPAQAIAVPKKPKPAEQPASQPTSQPPLSQPQITCRYQGQTRVCD